MIRISDKDALAKMAILEGESWLRDQNSEFESPQMFGFWYAKEQQEKYAAKMAPSVDDDVEEKTYKAWAMASAVPGSVIYGLGGWTRWFVLGTGEIVFSLGHGGEKRSKKAEEIGFRVWR